ncbi:MAG: DUF494 family protein [Bacteroidota bacterium]
MYEKIVEILIYVLNEVRKTNKPLGEIDISQLENKGYTDAEISTAFSWLFDRLRSGTESKPNFVDQTRGSFRVLHHAEQHVISSQAFGFLLQLQQLEIITDSELEIIIERAMLSGYDRLNTVDIHDIVASVLFDTDNARGQAILNSNDTIH